MDLKICYLHEQHRHCDRSLIQVLRDIRENNVSEDTMAHLRKRYKKDAKEMTPTKLYTHNIDVDAINKKHLDAIKGEERMYEMIANKGGKAALESLKKNCLAPEKLYLKKGAAIMFVKNNPEKKYFNGTLGEVVSFDSFGYPIVQIADNRKILVEKEDWNMEENAKIKASIRQLPLRLAWAITVHKSQGMSLEAAEIDLSKSFVEGMGYVALSRVKTLGGLKLMGLNDIALKVNGEILDFDKDLSRMSEDAADELKNMNGKDVEKSQKEFIESIAPKNFSGKSREDLTTYDITKDLVAQEMSIAEMSEEREMTEETIINHLEKLAELARAGGRGDEMEIEYLKPRQERFEKIKAAFEKTKGKKLTPVRRILGPRFPYNEIKLTRLFL